MFRLTCLLIVVLCVFGASSTPVDIIPIVSEESVVEENGKYHFSYESGDGTKFHEEGDNAAVDKDHAIETVHGGWEFQSPEGQKFAIEYTADETGYHPVGDGIAPIPEAIARSLKYNEEHPYKEPV